MRCFVAATFDDPTRERLERLLRSAPTAGLPVRWVRREGLHATLAFLGEIPAERADLAGRAMQAAARGHGPIPVGVGGVGGFPSARAARVVWVGVSDPTERLAAVQAALAHGLSAAGFALDDRAFHPHVTLGRVREGKVAVERCAARLPEVDAAPAPGYVMAVTLFQSDLGAGGSVYTPLATVSLGGTP